MLLAYGSAEQMKQSILTLNNIAELRRAKEAAEFFDSLPPDEQPAWLDDLRERLTVPAQGEEVPHVCLFDTGVNHGIRSSPQHLVPRIRIRLNRAGVPMTAMATEPQWRDLR